MTDGWSCWRPGNRGIPRQALPGESGNALQEALDELNAATLPLAELLMNSVVRSTLKDRTMQEVDTNKL